MCGVHSNLRLSKHIEAVSYREIIVQWDEWHASDSEEDKYI